MGTSHKVSLLSRRQILWSFLLLRVSHENNASSEEEPRQWRSHDNVVTIDFPYLTIENVKGDRKLDMNKETEF